MNNLNINSSDDILNIKTIQISPFRILMTALKDILLETNIDFTPNGIKIINMDKSHTVLTNMNLLAENFEYFECKKSKITIGVNMFHLFKLISSIDNDDTLTIYIDNNDYNDGIVSYLSLKFENKYINQCQTRKLRTIEPDHDEYKYPDVTFSSIINMPSVDFQKIIKDMAAMSDKVEIKSVGNELMFSYDGFIASGSLHRSESEIGMDIIKKQDNDKVIQGIFSLKNLSHFIKCTNLCSQIEIYLENNLPLIVKYNVASLGDIKLCLAPLPSSN